MATLRRDCQQSGHFSAAISAPITGATNMSMQFSSNYSIVSNRGGFCCLLVRKGARIFIARTIANAPVCSRAGEFRGGANRETFKRI